MKFKTRGNTSPQGKPRVYFTGHPADVKQFFGPITDAILKFHNCAVFYDEDPEHPEDEENFLSDLERMQLIVVAVTSRYVCGDTFAHNTVFQHAVKRHIPVLPILEEGGIEQKFNDKCGDLQYLDPNTRDDTAISFEEKLKKFLDSVLVGDELAAKVRAAFDAYVFLSYRKKDRRYAQQLMRLIHQDPFCRDIAIWYDEFLVPGENFNDAIRKAMEKSKLFALVVTPNLLENPNYIMSTEYPAAQETGKPILPAMLVPTDSQELAARYEAIPAPIDPMREGALSAALHNILAGVAKPENDGEPQHIFFIGLAYLGGIDVEVNYEFAVQLITRSAESGLPEAVEKLVAMYRTGEGVKRDYLTAIRWQERLAETCRAAYEAAPDEKLGRQWFNALWDLGDFWYELRQLGPAGKACRELAEAAQSMDAAYHAHWTQLNLVISYAKLGEISKAQGDLAGAKTFYEKGLVINEWLAAEVSAGTVQWYLAVSYEKLGDISQTQGDMAGAKTFFEKALAIRERLAAETDTVQARRDLSVSYIKMGDISRAQDDLARARAFYEKDLAVSARLAAETGAAEAWRGLLVSYDRLGNIRLAQRDLAGAKTFFEKCLAICERLVAETDTVQAWQDLAGSYHNLGGISKSQGDLTGARTFFEKCLAIYERLAAETGTVEARRNLSVNYSNLGDISQSRGDLARAKAFYEKSLAIDERLAAETDNVQMLQNLSVSYERLGDISQSRGDMAGAKDFYEKSLTIRERLVAETDSMQARRDLSVSCEKLGDISQSQGDLAETKAFYEKCLAIREQLVAETGTVEARRDLTASYMRMGEISKSRGDLAGARTFFEKCLAICERLAAEFGTIEAHDDLAASCFKMAVVSNTAEEQQGYLCKAAAIWSWLAGQCPDVRRFGERLALVRKHLR